MDNFCIWMETLLRWADRSGVPSIPWIGQAGTRFNSPPAKHLELVYSFQGGYKEVQIGARQVSIPERHLSLHYVHHWNHSPALSPAISAKRRAWCCFFDVGDSPEFAALNRDPLFCCVPVFEDERLLAAFQNLQSCLQTIGHFGGYLDGSYAYHLSRAKSLQPAQFFMVKSTCLALLAAALHVGEQHSNNAPSLSSSLHKALEFISLHASEQDLRLDTIARSAGLSVDHFGRLFKAELRTTPMHYLQTIRVEHARFLLRHTHLNISEIAEESGFADPYYFSRTFHNLIGTSPRAYRASIE
jgi:AraC-like DNA-binding protein